MKRINLTWFLIIIALIWGVSIPIEIWIFGIPSSAGEFGDLFGAVNALFSGLALVLIIYNIILQREELSLQREELMLSRKELSNQSEIMAGQLETMRKNLEIEFDKRKREIEFNIKWDIGTSSDNKWVRFKFTNLGGILYNPEVIASFEGKQSISPNSVIHEFQEALVEFVAIDKLPEEIEFQLKFTDRQRNPITKSYKGTPKEAKVVEIT